MKSFLTKAIVLSALGIASISMASAATPVVPLSCPSVDTLNDIVKNQGMETLLNFTDQGMSWSVGGASLTKNSPPFKSFLGVLIPTKMGLQKQIKCLYRTIDSDPKYQNLFTIIINADAGPFTGKTGDWFTPAKSSCDSQRADGCTFVRDIS